MTIDLTALLHEYLQLSQNGYIHLFFWLMIFDILTDFIRGFWRKKEKYSKFSVW